VGALQQARETQEEKESMDHLLSLSLSSSHFDDRFVKIDASKV
jgi:hypothetical protein